MFHVVPQPRAQHVLRDRLQYDNHGRRIDYDLVKEG